MPYKHKKDKAKQMRRYRAHKKQEKQSFIAQLEKIDPKIGKQLQKQFPSFFPQQKSKRKRKK